jgi:6-phosphofructokinase
MGRHCGFIAMNAALAARDVDICHLALKIALTSGDLMGFKVYIFHMKI